MTEFVTSQIIATVFYLCTGAAIGFMLGKLNTRKTAQSIVKEMERIVKIENEKKGKERNE
jgi:hypothetical protein